MAIMKPGKTPNRSPGRACGPILALLLSGSLALLAGGGKPWNEKSLDQFTDDDLLQLLTDSPWARKIAVWQSTGRVLAKLASGETAIHRASRTSPAIEYSVPTVSTHPERMHSVYTVRWSSAPVLAQGHARLAGRARFLAELHSVPSSIPPGEIVITVRIAEPPRPSASDRLSRAEIFKDNRPLIEIEFEPPTLFSGRKDDELLAVAKLRISGKVRLTPLRLERHGLGAAEAFSFFFDRTGDDGPVVTEETRWAEFRLKDDRGTSLKARFRLREMRISGTPNF